MSRAKVTVIVPVFNTNEKYLGKCITSIKEQTLEEIEIIIVDDGSGTNISQMLDDIATEDCRIKIIHKENGGVSSARNAALDIAEGEYITFIDSDDWIDLQCLEEAYHTAIKENADMVGWRFCREYEKKQVEINIFNEDKLVYSRRPKREVRDFSIFDMRIMGYTTMKLYRQELFRKRRYTEELINGEDVELNFRLYTDIQYAVYIDKPFYHYRFVPGSAVRGYNDKFVERYNDTLTAIEENVKGTANSDMKSAYLDFAAISYLMLCMNYVFSPKNPGSYGEKVRELKKISKTAPYSEAIAIAPQLKIPLTRKMTLIFAKYKFYFGILCIMKVKFWLNRIYD